MLQYKHQAWFQVLVSMNIVTKIMEIERQAKIDNLTSKKSLVNAQISAYGSLKARLFVFSNSKSV